MKHVDEQHRVSSGGFVQNRLANIEGRCIEPFARTYLTSVQADADLEELAERHRPIVAALRTRDGALAARVMHDHLIQAAALVQEEL